MIKTILDKPKNKSQSTLEAARAYISRGWSVIPLKPKDKRPLIPWKEYQTRLATPEELEEWFDGTDNNLGIVAGSISNLTIVDCDSPEAIAFFQETTLKHGCDPQTYQVKTAHGMHYYYQFVPGSSNFQAKREWPGVDLRSEGGYVAAVPSIHPTGIPYVLAENGFETPTVAPSWLFAKPTSTPIVPTVAAGDDLFAPALPGQRNMALTRLAGSLLVDLPFEKALKTCQMWNRSNPEPLPTDELVRTVQSVAQKEAAKHQEPPQRAWPQLDAAALSGLTGDIVNSLAPFTEADKVTLLVHILSEFSCIIGRGPHIRLDGDYVPLSFWPVVVGDTSKSRKGSGAKRIKRLFQAVDPTWTRGRHSGSLSSGEGLIYAVRDAEWGVNAKGEEILRDEGIVDKRLYLVQSEFGAMLRIMARDGNSLSGHLRETWDGETLKPMTKGFRIQATHPHIVVAGHVTRAELQLNFDNVEMANGFGNRFCWFVVKRSKSLPFPEDPPEKVLQDLVGQLQAALTYSLDVGEIGMTEPAKDWWRKGYDELSQGTPGLAGSLLDRAEAQVRRIAALYALLGRKREVEPEHLYAALVLWNYSVASVKFIFGEKVGDRIIDTIMEALKCGPLTDSELNALFGRHVSAERLAHAKETLRSQGEIIYRSEPTRGRPRNVWELCVKSVKSEKRVG